MKYLQISKVKVTVILSLSSPCELNYSMREFLQNCHKHLLGFMHMCISMRVCEMCERHLLVMEACNGNAVILVM